MKVFFKENLSLKRILGTDIKQSKVKAILIIVAIIYGFGTVLLGFGYMFFDFGRILAEAGMESLLLNFVFTYATFLSVFFVLFRANGYLFHYKDFDILQPLPIHVRTVILAKLTVMLSFIYITVFLVISPIAFSYFYHSGFDIFKLLIMIVLLFMVPIIPLVIFAFLSLLIARFSATFRFGKALNIILMFVLFFGIMIGSMTMNFAGDNPLSGQMDFLEGISKYLVTGKWFVNAIHEFNILALLGVIGVSLALLAGFVLLIEKVVVKTNQMNLTTRVSNSKKAAVSKQRPMILNIIQKELKKFFNVTIYVFNSGFGPIVLAIGGLAVLIFKEDLIGAVDLFSELNLSIEPLLLIVVGFIISTVFTSAISLSLEGKNFWLLKSLPIKAETVMFGKMFFNVLIVLPFAIFFIFMAGIALEIELINVLVSIIYVTSLSFLSSALGSIVNLHFPKFNYVNETEVVKQSLGAILGMFSTWLILTINGFMYYYLFEQMSFALIALLAVVVNVVLLVFAVVYIKTQSEKIFSHLP